MNNTNHANRGKSLETLIEYANAQYKAKGLALIQKVPTPWTVQRVGKRIVSAFPAEKSTVDFIGLSNGVPIAFDAKQCHNKTSFPLSNIEDHQLKFLHGWKLSGGISFLLIEMTALRKIYRVEHDQIISYCNASAAGGRKSIPIKDFGKFEEVRESNGIVLDYLNLGGKTNGNR